MRRAGLSTLSVAFTLSLTALAADAGLVRIYITNSAGDSIHVIDPATNKVVQEIKGIEAAHGIDFATDGSKVYRQQRGRLRRSTCSTARAASSSRRSRSATIPTISR